MLLPLLLNNMMSVAGVQVTPPAPSPTQGQYNYYKNEGGGSDELKKRRQKEDEEIMLLLNFLANGLN